ncbi:MAG: methylmalonyl-CoA mutase subunit beta, partial [Bacteroidales bacterium]|nr:methylmalonyl-CoA mutase subunit beta [Bacteroidales bacterium]
MSNQLFAEFPPVSTQQWEAVIEKDLKGADYHKRLVWKTDEGLSIPPYCRRENLKDIKYLDAIPGCFPYVRGARNNNDWLVRQSYCAHDNYKEANRQALDGIAKGVDSVGFCIDGSKACTLNDMELLLSGIDLKKVPVNFEGCHCSTALSYITGFTDYLQKHDIDERNVRCVLFDVDPLRHLTTHGAFAHPDSMKRLKACVEAIISFPSLRTVGVEAYAIHAAGAGIVQELAFGLAMGSEYLHHLIDRESDIEAAPSFIHFTFAVGSSYFMEIAKFRAARLLWANIVKAYGADWMSMDMMVHAVTSPWNQTVYDPYVNMLRGTTEAMSAAIAGVDSIEVLPFDHAFRAPNEFSNRIARNTQIILKEEAYFDKVTDPAAGSYYIESLTQAIVDAAWKLFNEVE